MKILKKRKKKQKKIDQKSWTIKCEGNSITFAQSDLKDLTVGEIGSSFGISLDEFGGFFNETSGGGFMVGAMKETPGTYLIKRKTKK